MVEIVPILLILLSWNPSAPADSMNEQHAVQLNLDDCDRAGREFVTANRAPNRHVKYFCIPYPSTRELEDYIEKHR